MKLRLKIWYFIPAIALIIIATLLILFNRSGLYLYFCFLIFLIIYAVYSGFALYKLYENSYVGDAARPVIIAYISISGLIIIATSILVLTVQGV